MVTLVKVHDHFLDCYVLLEAIACAKAVFPVAAVPPVASPHPTTIAEFPAAEPVQEIAPVACAPRPVQ